MKINSYGYRNGLPLTTEVASIRPVFIVKIPKYQNWTEVDLKDLFLSQEEK